VKPRAGAPYLRHDDSTRCRAMLIVILALQAVPQPGNRPMTPNDELNRFDLATARPKSGDNRCGGDDGSGDIVVCARKKMMDVDTSRMPDFAEKPVRSIVALPGGAKAGIGTTAREVGGFPSNAIMAKLKIGF
jgi:hypothetical protein